MPKRTGWDRKIDDPIELPRRAHTLVTLKDAAEYLMKLPKAEQSLVEWQTTIACLIGTAEARDFMMHARIGNVEGDEPATFVSSICIASPITRESGS
jgi:hypothetical protein